MEFKTTDDGCTYVYVYVLYVHVGTLYVQDVYLFLKLCYAFFMQYYVRDTAYKLPTNTIHIRFLEAKIYSHINSPANHQVVLIQVYVFQRDRLWLTRSQVGNTDTEQ